VCHGEGHGRGEEPGSAAPMNLSAYGARNAERVTTGTWETLPGPTAPSEGRGRSVGSYNR